MTTKKQRHTPLWDSLKKREAYEKAERWAIKGRQRSKLAPEFRSQDHVDRHCLGAH